MRLVFKCTLVASIVLCGALGQSWFPERSSRQDGCTTPDGLSGECIELRSCHSLLSLVVHRPISRTSANFLRNSQCGFVGNQPKVCCPAASGGGGGSNESGAGPVRGGGSSSSGGGRPTRPEPNRGVISSGTSLNGGSSSSTGGGGGRGGSSSGGQRGSLTGLLPSRGECGLGLENRIFGGEATDLDEFPWMALLEYTKPNGKGFYCGGVLISSRYVLTAAHCVSGKDIPATWRLTGVRLGEYNTDTEIDCVAQGPRGTLESAIAAGYCSDPPVDLAITERVVHESYNPNSRNQQNDIALLRLERNVDFTDYVKPVCLPNPNEQSKSFVGESLYVAGWGKTETRSESSVKLKLEVPVVTQSSCASVYSGVSVQIGTGQLCAGGERGRDSCRGDSGGPLMALDRNTRSPPTSNWIVAGIVSFGPSPCGMQGWPGVYTKVGDYVGWIESKLRA